MKGLSSSKKAQLSAVVLLSLLSASKASQPIPCMEGCTCWASKRQHKIICRRSVGNVLPLDVPHEIDSLEFFDVPSLNINGLHVWQGYVRFLGVYRCGIKEPLLLPNGLQELTFKETEINATLLEQCLSQERASLLLGLTIVKSPITIGEKLQHIFHRSPILLTLSLSEIHIPFLSRKLLNKNFGLRHLEIKHCALKSIEDGAIQQLTRLRSVALVGNELTSLKNTSFIFPSGLRHLDLSSNLFTTFPLITGPKILMLLNLSSNLIANMANLAHSSLENVQTMLLSQNKIQDIRSSMIGKCTFGFLLDLSSNELTTVRPSVINHSRKVAILNLGENMIAELPSFYRMQRLLSLYVYKNELKSIEGDIFNGTALKVLLLHGNKINGFHRPFAGLKDSLNLLTLFENPIRSLDAYSFRDLNSNTEVGLCFDWIKYVDSSDNSGVSFTCPRFKKFVLPKVDYSLSKSLLRQGFECDSNLKVNGAGSCSACLPGNFNKGWIHCRPCPRGGFYQDEAAQTYCKRCNKGQFVNFEGGGSSSNCKTCPFGTDPNQYADTRACYCLPDFSRNDRFGPCAPCSGKSLVCRNGSRELAEGFWWQWDENMRRKYDCFRKNLLTKGENYDTACNSFTSRLPRQHRCPTRRGCLGGINATCHPHYCGPLCSLCRKGYYKSGPYCFKCLDRYYAIVALFGVWCLVILFIVLLYKLSSIKLKSLPSRTRGDVFVSIWKILLTFYQLIPIVVSLLSVLQWPELIVTVTSKLQSFLVQVLSLQFLTCVFQHMTITAYSELVIALCMTGSVFAIFAMSLLLHICGLRRNRERWINQDLKSLCKSYVKNILLILFVIYPGLCQRIFQVLPFNCHKICIDYEKENCTSYLRVDYGAKCPSSDATKFVYVKLAYWLLPIPPLFPAILLALLWYEHKHRKLIPGGNHHFKDSCMTRFLYENYHDKYWFWEIIELLRKLLYSIGFAFFGFNTKTNLGYLIVISGLFLVLYAYIKPVRYSMEHYLQTISLSCIFLTVCIALLLDIRINANSGYLESKKDKLGIKVILLMIIAFPLLCLMVRFLFVLLFRTWRKENTLILEPDAELF